LASTIDITPIDSTTSDTLPLLLIQLVEANRSALATQYHKSLKETMFTNRPDVHPSALRRIASDEVDALLNFLRSPQSTSEEHGAQLCKIGLSEKSLLKLGWMTNQFIVRYMESEQIRPAIELIDSYQEGVMLGFSQAREATILSEQERIRQAFEQTISRFTVEIREVQSLAQRATEANEFKSRFIARISHELRTPLGAILGMSEMLQSNIYGPLTPAQNDIIQRVVNNVHTLERVFAELSDQTQIEAGQLHLREAPFSPQALGHLVYSNCLSLALQNNLALHLNISQDLPNILIGDSKRIEQVLNNLVINAIKYTETGHIDINVTKHDGARWGLHVTDTGIGISQEAQAFIFEPFRQVDESVGRKYEGVGLGLSIVHELVTIMGGTVSVESAVGQGSTFSVLLPLRAWGPAQKE